MYLGVYIHNNTLNGYVFGADKDLIVNALDAKVRAASAAAPMRTILFDFNTMTTYVNGHLVDRYQLSRHRTRLPFVGVFYSGGNCDAAEGVVEGVIGNSERDVLEFLMKKGDEEMAVVEMRSKMYGGDNGGVISANKLLFLSINADQLTEYTHTRESLRARHEKVCERKRTNDVKNFGAGSKRPCY